jgi:hypothetical protein
MAQAEGRAAKCSARAQLNFLPDALLMPGKKFQTRQIMPNG